MEYWYRYRDDLWKRVTIWDTGEGQTYHEKKQDSTEKMKCNIRRAARMIEGYALCNPWTWFGTFTLSPKYRDRTDLDGFRSDFMQFIRDSRKKYGNVEALLVPELHKAKDGWHMHGLLQRIPVEALRPFTLQERLPKYIRSKLKAGEPVYDWTAYRQSFGWVDMEPVRSRDAAARYITKDITKGWTETPEELKINGSPPSGSKSQTTTPQAIELGKHLYYVTRGLAQPERIETENAPGSVPEAFPAGLVLGNRYEFEYGVVDWFQHPRLG